MPTRDDPAGPARPPAGAGLTVARVPVADTHPLRRQVLRPGAPLSRTRLPVDDRPDTAAFAARTDDGRVVGTAIVYPESCPWQPDRPGAWRLRGMATAEGHRGAGIGARVLGAVIDHAVEHGGALVWCNARVPARRFYERAGFVAHGDPWDEPEIGPHIRMSREL